MATAILAHPRKCPEARRKNPTLSEARKPVRSLHGKRIPSSERFRAASARPRSVISFPHFARAPCRVRNFNPVSLAALVVPTAPLPAGRPGMLLHQMPCREPVLPQQSALPFRAAETFPIGEVQ